MGLSQSSVETEIYLFGCGWLSINCAD